MHDFVIDNIQLDNEIGRGANGRILEAKWEGRTVAVKEIHSISKLGLKTDKSTFFQKCEQSRQLCHPNIVCFFGIYNPPGARVPSLVMERLHCSLTNLLEQDPLLPIKTKLSIIHDVAQGLKYLHAHIPIIIHRDLSSNNILISKAMKGKIGNLSTAHLMDSTRQSQMTKAVDFMPPEALAASGSVECEKELDLFSFGCVMLHTLSHQWPTPSEPVVTDPVTFEIKGRTEVERRSSYFDKIEDRAGMLIPTIKSCLNNIPKKRTSIVQVCSQLEGLVDKQDSPTDETDIPSTSLYHFQASKSSSDFWNSLKQTWKKCADLPVKYCATSVAELNRKVYVAVSHRLGSPLMYDPYKDEWSVLPELPRGWFSLVAIPYKKQLLAIGGLTSNDKVSNKVSVWDEDNKRWTTPYPNMPTARYYTCSISHGSSVIVAGGKTCQHPSRLTGVVEVLYITEYSTKSNSYWSVVEQLPHVVYAALPLIIDDKLYIVSGYDNDGQSTRNIVTASLPELLQSSDKKTGNVWHKLPDMPYTSWSIIHYQGHLIILNGDHMVEQSGVSKSVWKLAQQSYLYNPNTKSWDYVGDDLHDYKLGRSVYIRENKIFFIGGETGTFKLGKDDMVKTCSILTFKPK